MPTSQTPPRPPFERVLLTGAAGFIGSRVIPILRAMDIMVIALDNEYVGIPLPPAEPGLAVVNADLRDADAVAAAFAAHRPDAILHLAAVHHIPTCERKPHLAFDVNVMGTQVLIDAAAEAGVRNMVMASSGAVYQWMDGPLDEQATPTGATDVYSITKLANEYQVGGWADRVDGRAHMVRLFNTIGSGDPNGHLIPDILAQIAGDAEQPVIRLGNTVPKRDYIYVDDVAAGFVAALANLPNGPARDTFNLCTGQEMSVAGLVELLGKIMGKHVVIETDPARIRKIDRLQQLGDPARLQAATGWAPVWTLEDALRQIVTDLGYTAQPAVAA